MNTGKPYPPISTQPYKSSRAKSLQNTQKDTALHPPKPSKSQGRIYLSGHNVDDMQRAVRSANNMENEMEKREAAKEKMQKHNGFVMNLRYATAFLAILMILLLVFEPLFLRARPFIIGGVGFVLASVGIVAFMNPLYLNSSDKE